MADELKRKDEGPTLLSDALMAYGIDKQYVLASKHYPKGRDFQDTRECVCVVTNGGAKVLYRRGDSVEPLNSVAVHGRIPKRPKRK